MRSNSRHRIAIVNSRTTPTMNDGLKFESEQSREGSIAIVVLPGSRATTVPAPPIALALHVEPDSRRDRNQHSRLAHACIVLMSPPDLF